MFLLAGAHDVVGRELELTDLTAFVEAVPAGPTALVLSGEAGIGKTTLWRQAVVIAEARGYLIAATSPAESERQLPFAALADLLHEVPAAILSQLPGPQQRAIDVALLRREAEGTPQGQHALSLGTLSVLRLLATSAPVVLSVDDAQWLDAPSARVLQFAIRRLEREPIGILIAVRQDHPEAAPLGLEKALPRDRVRSRLVGPLSLDFTDELLSQRFGARFSRPTLMDLHRTSGGNPFFALEIGRFLLTRQATPGRQSLPIPQNLRDLVESRLTTLDATTREVLLVVSALSQPTDELVEAAMGGQDGWAVGVRRAMENRLIERSAGRLRLSHPIIGSVVYAAAGEERRHSLHRRLAAVVEEPEEHARHLALAADAPGDDVANALELAAERAVARGAPEAAAALLEHARDLTPARRQDDIRRRTLKAADHYLLVGETRRARAMLEPLAGGAPRGRSRAEVLHRLGKIRVWEEPLNRAEDLLQEALSEAVGDSHLTAAIERDLSMVLMQRGDLRPALRHAQSILARSGGLETPEMLSGALALTAMADCLLGNGVSGERIQQALRLAEQAEQGSGEAHPSYLQPLLYLGTVLKWTDDFESARKVLTHLLERFGLEHEETGLAPCLFQLGELECWAGNWQRAAAYAEQATKAVLRSGQPSYLALPRTLQASVFALRGVETMARATVHEALFSAEQAGDTRFAMRALAVLGFLELSVGNLASCLDHLHRVRQMASELEYGDPGVLRFDADEIEAMIALGQLETADELTSRLEERGKRLQRAWALATTARCRAMLAAARGDLDAALAALDRALEEHRRLAQPLELGRTLLFLGVTQRRTKDRRSARDTLERAEGIFERLGAAQWSMRARAELARVGGRPRTADELSPTERRVAALVAGGATNREVAARLFLSLKTVEANLSKIYQKLGLRSRTELAARATRHDGKV